MGQEIDQQRHGTIHVLAESFLPTLHLSSDLKSKRSMAASHNQDGPLTKFYFQIHWNIRDA
jgi:hypothetical protein